MTFPEEDAGLSRHGCLRRAGIRSAWGMISLAVSLGILTVCCPQTPAKAAANGPQPIAVRDFSIPTAESNRWAWAEGGMADLLQIELEHLGLVTLDRDFIHAVLAEQRLSASGLTPRDQLKLAMLLNARHLVTGRILPLEDGRLRVEATAFSVEAIESVGTGAR